MVKETPNFRQGGKEEACKEDQFETLCFDLWHPFFEDRGSIVFSSRVADCSPSGLSFLFLFSMIYMQLCED